MEYAVPGCLPGAYSILDSALVHGGESRIPSNKKEIIMNKFYTVALVLVALVACTSVRAEWEAAKVESPSVKAAANKAAAAQALAEADAQAYDLESARARGRSWSQFSKETGGRALGGAAGVDGLVVSTIAAPFTWTASGLDQLADSVTPEADKARAKARALEVKRLEEKYEVDLDDDGKIAGVVIEATETK